MLSGTLETELNDILTNSFLFAHLQEETLHWLAQQFEVVTCKIGQTVVAEGEPGDAAFLIHSGKLRVVKQGPDEKPITLATLTVGDFFGEHALSNGEPRSATVRASQDSLLFRLRRDDFLELIRTQPELRVRFDQLIENRALARFLQTSTIFHLLPPRDTAAFLARFQSQRFDEGDCIIREGDTGDEMFVLTAGDAKAVKGAVGKETVLAYLGPGDYFGERALLQEEPRYASVIALSEVETAVLNREHFEILVAKCPQIREQLAKHVADYAAREEAARKFGLRTPRTSALEKIQWETIDDDENVPATRVLKHERRRVFGLKWGYPFIPQEDETDCGAAALAMIARFHNVRLSIERLRDLAYVGATGASGLGLLRAAESIGYECRPINTDYGHLGKLRLPAIAHWKGWHFLVVYEAKDNQTVIGDPAEGLLTMRRDKFEEGWTGGLFLLTPTAKLGEVAPSRSAWRWLRPLLAPLWLEFLILAGLAVFVAAGKLSLALLLQPAVDHMLLAGQTEWLIPLGGAATIITCLIFAAAAVRRFRLPGVLEQLHQRISAALADRLWQLPISTFSSRQPGRYLKQFHETDSIYKPNTERCLSALLALALPAFGICILAIYHFGVPLAASAVWLLAGLHLALLTPPLLRCLRRQDVCEIRKRTHWYDAVAAHSTVKKNATEPHEIQARGHFLKKQAELTRHEEKLKVRSLAYAAITPILGALITLALVAALTVSDVLTFGQFTAVSAILFLSFAPLFHLVFTWPELLRWLLFAQQQADFQDVKSERSLQRQNQSPHLRGRIFLQDVSFRHSPESRDVLSHLQLDMAPGHFLWIVGRSGAGKTTLAMLLQGHNKPSSGTIRFDGHDLRDIDLAHLRRHVCIVGETPEIIAGSVRDNLALQNDFLDRERIINAATLANAHDFIMDLPLGYETHLGLAGVQLSISQKQQICIARAVLADPRILILDDATALLDRETEAEVLKNLRWFAAGRTLMIMTRRKPEAVPADEIVVLDEGRIVEKGTHSELVQQRGLYSAIIHGQSRV